jgi:hypothetical protein
LFGCWCEGFGDSWKKNPWEEEGERYRLKGKCEITEKIREKILTKARRRNKERKKQDQ